MAYARIAVIHLQPSTNASVVAEDVKGPLLRMLREQAGFTSYTLVKTGEHTVTAIVMWQTREQAEEGFKRAEEFNRQVAGIASVEATLGEVMLEEHA